MKRILIPFIAALVASLGVTTGITLLRRPAPAATTQTDKVAGDSTAATTGDSVTSATDSTKHVADDSTATSTTTSLASVAGAASGTTAAKPTSTTGTGTTAAPSTPANSHQVARGNAHDTTARQVPVHQTAAASTVTPKAGTDSGNVTYLAKTFISMPARTAATVMQGMPDDDIAIILSGMNAKQRGAILGSFPTERATKIVRTILHDTEGR